MVSIEEVDKELSGNCLSENIIQNFDIIIISNKNNYNNNKTIIDNFKNIKRERIKLSGYSFEKTEYINFKNGNKDFTISEKKSMDVRIVLVEKILIKKISF